MATEQETFAQRLESAQLTSTPTSQTVAEGLGATPQQIAMTGTEAQKKATIADRISASAQPQQQELFRAQRLAEPRREATVDEQLEAERQEQLSRLGNIGLSIQNRIQQSISEATQQQLGQIDLQAPLLAQTLGLQGPQVDLAKADPNSQYNQIANALQQFTATGDANDLEAAMATIDNLRSFGISSADAKRLVGLTQDALARQTGTTVAENVLDQVTLKDLDLQDLGFDQGLAGVADTLGKTVEEIQDLTVDELASTVEDVRKNEFARVEKLKAQLAAAPLGSTQREILLRELRDLGAVGLTGVEAEAAETVEEIDLANTIKVGDEMIQVSEFLDDENLSQLVMDWINEDDIGERERMLPSEDYPELVAWIEANQKALAQLSETADDTAEQYTQANEAYQDFNNFEDLDVGASKEVMQVMFPDWDPTKKITSRQLQDIQTKFNTSLLGNIKNGRYSTEEKKDLINKFNSVPPEQLEQLKTMSVDEVRIASAAADTIQENPDLAEFLNVPQTGPFLMSRNAQESVLEYADAIENIQKNNPSWLQSGTPTYEALRTLSPADLAILTEKPERYNNLKLYAEQQNKVDSIGPTDYNRQLGVVFGTDVVDGGKVNDALVQAQQWAKLGDQEALEKANRLGKMLGLYDTFDVDGPIRSLTPQDVQALFAERRNTITELGPKGAVRGDVDLAMILEEQASQYNSRPLDGNPSTEFRKYADLIKNGVVGIDDLNQLPREEQDRFGEWVDQQDRIGVDLEEFASYRDWDNDRQEGEFIDLSDDLSQQVFGTDLTGWLDRAVQFPEDGRVAEADAFLQAVRRAREGAKPGSVMQKRLAELQRDAHNIKNQVQVSLNRRIAEEQKLAEEEARRAARGGASIQDVVDKVGPDVALKAIRDEFGPVVARYIESMSGELAMDSIADIARRVGAGPEQFVTGFTEQAGELGRRAVVEPVSTIGRRIRSVF